MNSFSQNILLSSHYHAFPLSPHSSIILRSVSISVFLRCICTPLFTAILPPSPISLPHLFSLTARSSPAPFTAPLLAVLTSLYFSCHGFFLSMFISLSVPWRGSTALQQLQVSAKQMLFSLPLHAWSATESRVTVNVCAAATAF